MIGNECICCTMNLPWLRIALFYVCRVDKVILISAALLQAPLYKSFESVVIVMLPEHTGAEWSSAGHGEAGSAPTTVHWSQVSTLCLLLNNVFRFWSSLQYHSDQIIWIQKPVRKNYSLEEPRFSEEDKIQLFFVSNPFSGNVLSLYTTWTRGPKWNKKQFFLKLNFIEQFVGGSVAALFSVGSLWVWQCDTKLCLLQKQFQNQFPTLTQCALLKHNYQS